MPQTLTPLTAKTADEALRWGNAPSRGRGAPAPNRTDLEVEDMARTTRTTRKATTAVTPEATPTEAPEATPTEAPGSTTDEATAPTFAIKVDGKVIPVVAPEHTHLVTAYGAADTGAKTKIRNAVKAAMEAAVRDMDITTAKVYMDAQEALKATATKATAQVNYNQVLADRIITLIRAATLMLDGNVTPEGMPSDQLDLEAVRTAVQAYRDGRAVTDEVDAAARKLAGAKVTRTTERGDIESLIASAVAGVPVGTFLTVAAIAKASGARSQGAIGARLWPTKEVNGVKVNKPTTIDLTALGIELTTRDGVRGVRKIADVVTTDETD